MRSKRMQASASVGPRKTASSCLGMSRRHDKNEGFRTGLGGCFTDGTVRPPSPRVDAFVADGSDPRLPVGCLRLSRGPAAVAEPLRQNGHIYARALRAPAHGVCILFGHASLVLSCWLYY